MRYIAGLAIALQLTPLGFAKAETEATHAAKFAEIEAGIGGRIGVAALDVARDKKFEYRAQDRFTMCSTFKVLAVAAVLKRVDEKREKLDRFVRYGEAELLSYAPVTRAHVKEGGMTLEALCAAAIEQSDNTAGNLLLDAIGGPKGWTEFARSLGDNTTRLDRNEPEIRAGVPPDWKVGDKTGRSGTGIVNDIAIVRPPRGGLLFLAIYTSNPGASAEARDELVATIAKAAIEALNK